MFYSKYCTVYIVVDCSFLPTMAALARSFQRLTMPRFRLRVLQSHLCCSTQSSCTSTSIEETPVQRTLYIVNTIAKTDASRGVDVFANNVMDNYKDFSQEERLEFLTKLSVEFQSDSSDVLNDMAALTRAADTPVPHRQKQKLRESLVSPYEILFRGIGSAAGGVKFLVDLRSHLISATRGISDTEQVSALQAMNRSLKEVSRLYLYFVWWVNRYISTHCNKKNKKIHEVYTYRYVTKNSDNKITSNNNNRLRVICLWIIVHMWFLNRRLLGIFFCNHCLWSTITCLIKVSSIVFQVGVILLWTKIISSIKKSLF